MPNRTYRVLVCLALLLPTAAAQVTVEAVTRSVITAQAVTRTTQTNTIPANTPVSTGFKVTASSRYQTFCFASAEAQLSVGRIFGGDNVELHCSAGATSQGCSGRGAASGSVLVRFKSSTPVAGKLIVTVQGGGSVDVGADGSRELVGAGQTTADGVVGPDGLQVILEGGTGASGNGSTSSRVAALFVPHSSRFTVVGKTCRGPVLGGFYSVSTIQLQVASVPRVSSH